MQATRGAPAMGIDYDKYLYSGADRRLSPPIDLEKAGPWTWLRGSKLNFEHNSSCRDAYLWTSSPGSRHFQLCFWYCLRSFHLFIPHLDKPTVDALCPSTNK